MLVWCIVCKHLRWRELDSRWSYWLTRDKSPNFFALSFAHLWSRITPPTFGGFLTILNWTTYIRHHPAPFYGTWRLFRKWKYPFFSSSQRFKIFSYDIGHRFFFKSLLTFCLNQKSGVSFILVFAIHSRPNLSVNERSAYIPSDEPCISYSSSPVLLLCHHTSQWLHTWTTVLWVSILFPSRVFFLKHKQEHVIPMLEPASLPGPVGFPLYQE